MISQLELEISQLEQGGAGASSAEPTPTEEVPADEPKPSEAKRACARSQPHDECGQEQQPLLLTGPVVAEEKKEQLQGGRPAPTKRTRKWVTGVGWLYSGGQGGAEGGAGGGAAKEEVAAAKSAATAERGPVLSPGPIAGPVVGSGPLLAHRAACPSPCPTPGDGDATCSGHGGEHGGGHGGGKRKRGELPAPPAQARGTQAKGRASLAMIAHHLPHHLPRCAIEAKGGAAGQAVRQVVGAKLVVTQEHAQQQVEEEGQVEEGQVEEEGQVAQKVMSLGGRQVVSEVNGLQLHLSKHSSTGYKGVVDCPSSSSDRPRKSRFKAQTTQGGPRMLGMFDSALEAAVCYARNLLEQKCGAAAAEGVEVVEEEAAEGEEGEGKEGEGEEAEGEGEEEEDEEEGEEEELTAKESVAAAKVEDLTLLRSDCASGFVNVERRALKSGGLNFRAHMRSKDGATFRKTFASPQRAALEIARQLWKEEEAAMAAEAAAAAAEAAKAEAAEAAEAERRERRRLQAAERKAAKAAEAAEAEAEAEAKRVHKLQLKREKRKLLAEERRRGGGVGGPGDGGELTQARLEAAEAAEAAAEAAAGPGLWPTGGLAEGAVRMRPACMVPGCQGEGGLRPAAAAAQSIAPGCVWDLDAPSGPPRSSLQCNLCHASWHSSWWEHLLEEEEQRQEQRQEYHHHAPIDQMLPDLQDHLQEAD